MPGAINRSHAARTGSVDIGLMQINSRWLPVLDRHGIREADLLDPCTNLQVGAWILAQSFQRHGATWEAVGAYHASCTQLRSTRLRRDARPLCRRRVSASQRRRTATASAVTAVPSHPLIGDSMMQSLPALPFPFRLIAGRKAARQPWLWAGALLLASLLLLATVPSYAIDLVNLGAIGGPLGSALNTLGTLTPGVKALVGFISFVVALISLAALRNFGPVLYYIGVAIFATVGLVIAGAIMGAVI